MARGPSTFRQRDVTAALKALRAADVDVATIKIGKDGSIEIDIGKPPEPTETIEQANEWDA